MMRSSPVWPFDQRFSEKPMSRSNLLLAGACTLALSACAQPTIYQAALTGAQSVPRTASTGTGTMTATVQPHSDAPSRAGITGSGSGADDM